MYTVGDESEKGSRLECGAEDAHDARLSRMEGRHRIEEMRAHAHAPSKRSLHLARRRVRMAGGGGHTEGEQLRDECLRMRQLRRKGDETHMGEVLAARASEGVGAAVWLHDVLLWVAARLARADKRPLEVHVQHSGSVARA